MMYGKGSNFSQIEFWSIWVVHLWVEDFLELFTTIMVAYVFFLLGVVRARVATTIIYLDIILYSIGGVLGTIISTSAARPRSSWPSGRVSQGWR